MGDTVLNSNLLWVGLVNETYFDAARLLWNFNSTYCSIYQTGIDFFYQ
jgi:hypothetical protein